MAEDGKLAPLCMALLAWSKEKQNGKSVQSAQIFCPRKMKWKIETVGLYVYTCNSTKVSNGDNLDTWS